MPLAPPARPLGSEIPPGVRRAIDSWFGEHGGDPQAIRRHFFQQMGYGSVEDAIQDVRDRWGDERSTAMRNALEADRAVARWNHGDRRYQVATMITHLHVPAPLYLAYVEAAIAEYVRDRVITEVEFVEIFDDPFREPVEFLNELFAARGIEYRFTADGRAEWHGDAAAYEGIVRPALDALGDGRLAGARGEFEAALGHLRVGTSKGREDAIEEAGKAVESAMKVLLAERGIALTGREAAFRLFELLRDNGIAEAEADNGVLAAARIRNQWGGHGSGAAPRDPPADLTVLAVHSAGSAIVFLASRLP